MFLQLLAIIGSTLGFISLTLSLASGLYYLSELIEENLVLTKKILKNLLLLISILFILIYLFDNLPLNLILFSLFSNFIYNLNLKKFPNNLNLLNPLFLFTCLLALINHLIWFNYFNNPYIPTINERLNENFKLPYYPNFTEIASFFAILIWLFPFALFISISSNENGLPISIDNNNDNKSNKSNNLIKSLINNALLNLSSFLNLFGIKVNLSFNNINNNNNLNPNTFHV